MMCCGREISSYWTVLPPVPLYGVGTSMVESLSYYLRRIALISGTSVDRILGYADTLSDNAGGSGPQNYRSLMLGCPERYLFGLEHLTGIDHLRYGTFWVLKDLVGPRFLGRQARFRRWCPMCYAAWDSDSSYEPLIWAVGLLSCCRGLCS